MGAVQGYFYQEGNKTSGSPDLVASGCYEERFAELEGEE